MSGMKITAAAMKDMIEELTALRKERQEILDVLQAKARLITEKDAEIARLRRAIEDVKGWAARSGVTGVEQWCSEALEPTGKLAAFPLATEFTATETKLTAIIRAALHEAGPGARGRALKALADLEGVSILDKNAIRLQRERADEAEARVRALAVAGQELSAAVDRHVGEPRESAPIIIPPYPEDP